MIKISLAAALILLSLTSCTVLVGGIVGAAVTPLIQPQVDRVLGAMNLDAIDPGGVQAVKDFDSKKK